MGNHERFQNPMIDLDGKAIFITGGTGTFGKALADRILQKFKPRRLVIFSRDEMKQYDMRQDARFTNQECMRYFIGDVRDKDRLEMAMSNIDFVVHAAALKQVGAAEYNPFECIHTNVLGAENVVHAAIRNGVSRVISLSSDKATSPINLYGASKLASDKIFVAANYFGARATRFSLVRYGNVIGSRGSVVPFFQRLIDDGQKSLPITDERMTRFWITARQGVDFVLSSLKIMEGGEVFVPKIPSMSIVEVAHAMAPDLDHHVVGIRAGEKLHEALITEDDARNTYELDDRYVIMPDLEMWEAPIETYQALGAKKIDESFKYTSDSNDEWLSSEQFMNLRKMT